MVSMCRLQGCIAVAEYFYDHTLRHANKHYVKARDRKLIKYAQGWKRKYKIATQSEMNFIYAEIGRQKCIITDNRLHIWSIDYNDIWKCYDIIMIR